MSKLTGRKECRGPVAIVGTLEKKDAVGLVVLGKKTMEANQKEEQV